MIVHIAFQVLLLLVATVTTQFMQPMPQMPHAPFPFFPGQGHPMSMQLQNGMPGAMPVGMMPNMAHVPGMAHPMQMGQNGGRLPMVVMPHYTKKNEKRRKESKKGKKRNRKRIIKAASSSYEESCSSEEAEYRSRNDLRKSNRKKQEVLTPVVSYVTKDGYVIYQKKIKKEKAKDWLELSKDHSEEFFEKVTNSKKHHDHADHHHHH